MFRRDNAKNVPKLKPPINVVLRTLVRIFFFNGGNIRLFIFLFYFAILYWFCHTST